MERNATLAVLDSGATITPVAATRSRDCFGLFVRERVVPGRYRITGGFPDTRALSVFYCGPWQRAIPLWAGDDTGFKSTTRDHGFYKAQSRKALFFILYLALFFKFLERQGRYRES